MLEQIAEIIKKELAMEDAEITMETSFKDDLNADSLDLVELVMGLEEKYNTEIEQDDLENIATVGDLVEYLKSKGIE
ncbi:MAG: acyl carrier protein [Eubacterium sp.]|nr:acyl carrier protein [Eubacterium sp.]